MSARFKRSVYDGSITLPEESWYRTFIPETSRDEQSILDMMLNFEALRGIVTGKREPYLFNPETIGDEVILSIAKSDTYEPENLNYLVNLLLDDASNAKRPNYLTRIDQYSKGFSEFVIERNPIDPIERELIHHVSLEYKRLTGWKEFKEVTKMLSDEPVNMSYGVNAPHNQWDTMLLTYLLIDAHERSSAKKPFIPLVLLAGGVNQAVIDTINGMGASVIAIKHTPGIAYTVFQSNRQYTLLGLPEDK